MNIETANGPRWGDWRLILKLFLPSWNFFNDFDEVTRLEFCTQRAGAGESAWQPLHPPQDTRSWWRVIYNAQGNLELLEKSLIDRVATALRESPTVANDGFAQSEGGVMLTRITRARLQALATHTTEVTFRFRLVVVHPGNTCETLFESVAHPLTESVQ